MIRKLILIMIFVLTLVDVFGQNIYSLLYTPEVFSDSDASLKIDLNLNYFANSNSITNSFIDAAFSDKIIENRQKQDVTSMLKENNRLGYKLEYGGDITFKSKWNNYNIKIGINTVEHIYAKFSDDMFDLFLYGNKHLAGQSIELTPFSYTYYSYEKLSLGITNLYSDDNIVLGADISFIKGSRYQNAMVNHAEFYTSFLGDSLSLVGDGEGSFSDDSKKKITSFNGLGMAVNIDFSYLLNNKDIVKLKLDDLGFIKWKDLPSYRLDNSYLFQGLEVDNIVNASDSALSDLGFESLLDFLGADSTNSSRNFFIPARLEVLYFKKLNNKIAISPGVKYLFHKGYIPKLFVSAHITIPWNVYLSPIISIGGYSRFDYGLGMQKVEQGKYSIGFFTYFIEDLIVPGKSTSQGLRINASVFF